MVELGVNQRLPATASSIPQVREAIRQVGERAGVGRQQLAAIGITATEAATNAVRHAYGSGEAGLLDVDAHVDANHLVVRVRDYGVGLGRRSAAGGLGLGLRLMRHLADECVLESCDPGTRVWLRFRLGPPGKQSSPRAAQAALGTSPSPSREGTGSLNSQPTR